MNNFRKLKYVIRDVQLVVCDVGKIDMPQFKKKKKKKKKKGRERVLYGRRESNQALIPEGHRNARQQEGMTHRSHGRPEFIGEV